MKFWTILLFAICIAGALQAQPQPPEILWTRTYGGQEKAVCTSLVQTTDDGFVLGGYISRAPVDYNDHDITIMKTNANGDSLWSWTYDTETRDKCVAVLATSGGGVLVVGNIGIFDSCIVVRFDENSDSLWSRTYDRWYSNVDIINGAGYTLRHDNCLISYDANGEFLDSLFLDIDAPTNESYYCPNFVLELENGSFLVGGSYYDTIFDYGWLAATDPSGSLLWSNVYYDYYTCFYTGQEVQNGNLACVGSYPYEQGIGIFSSEGSAIFWNDDENFRPIDLTVNQQGIVVLGGIGNNMTVRGLGSSGDSLWNLVIPSNDENIRLSGSDIVVIADSGYAVAGWTYFNIDSIHWDYDFMLIRLTADTIVGVSQTPPLPFGCTLHPNFPNPFNPTTSIRFDLPKMQHITLNVYNVMGQTVARLADGVFETGQHELMFDGSALASGVYFYRLEAGDFLTTRKMVLLK